MAIKLRKFSYAAFTKAVIFILTVLFATSAAVIGNYLMQQDGNQLDKLIHPNYFESSAYSQQLLDTCYEIQTQYEMANNKGFTGYYNSSLNENISFFVSNSTTAIWNTMEDDVKSIVKEIESHNVYYSMENGVRSGKEYGNSNTSFNNMRYSPFLDNDTITLYFAYEDAYISDLVEQWSSGTDETFILLLLFSVFFILTVCLVPWLIAAAGKRGKDHELHLCAIDRWYTDILAVLLCLTVWVWVYSSDYLNYSYASSSWFTVLVSVIISVATIPVILGLGLSLVRQAKNHSLIKNSLLYRIRDKILAGVTLFWRTLRELFDGTRFKKYPMQKAFFTRQMLFLCIQFILVLFFIVGILMPPLFLLPLFFMLLLTVWYMKGNKRLLDDITALTQQVDEIYQGNLQYIPQITKDSPLYHYAGKLSGIGIGMQKSLEKQIKGERMKIDLVTNVSHDLKTPLTSIISYIDLLSKEETLSPEAQDYVRILMQKSDRLKNIVSDLFDLARITSGNAQMEYEELDLHRLIVQTLADMSDRIQASGLIIRTKLPEGPVPVFSDGKKLYRVYQNVIGNALKYSLEGTRVFIDLWEEQGRAYAVVKNTAGYEMEFSEEEILERFTRGDKARSTEGSGLGLSIAQNLTTACGGMFDLTIDGDLFKVQTVFPVSTRGNTPPRTEQ